MSYQEIEKCHTQFQVLDPRCSRIKMKCTYISMSILLMFWAHLEASKAATSSEQPQSLSFTSELEFVAQTAYESATMFVWAF